MAPPPNLAALLDTRVYPGMTAAESRILRAWIEKHGHEWDSLNVEARLGTGTLLSPHFSEKERNDWYQRTRARPDLVARRAPSVAAIVESKEQCTNEGIWQVKSYRDLFLEEFPGWRVQPTVVCVAITPTARSLAVAQGVHVFLYDFPPDQPLAPGAEAPPA